MDESRNRIVAVYRKKWINVHCVLLCGLNLCYSYIMIPLFDIFNQHFLLIKTTSYVYTFQHFVQYFWCHLWCYNECSGLLSYSWHIRGYSNRVLLHMLCIRGYSDGLLFYRWQPIIYLVCTTSVIISHLILYNKPLLYIRHLIKCIKRLIVLILIIVTSFTMNHLSKINHP